MNQIIYSKRRIFINAGKNYYQIFSFTQDPDGTIYSSSPDFSDAKWISYEITENRIKLLTTNAIGSGKITFHGSGVTGIRANSDFEHTLRIKGSNLLNKEQKSIGARHLFTAFITKPHYLPNNSPAFNRESDYAMRANEVLRPFVLIFFAVPYLAASTHLIFNLRADEMENIPNDLLGGHSFQLRYHNIFWFAYRTKNLKQWPKYSHFSYHDGFTIPVFIGTAPQEYRLEFRQPAYSLVDNKFIIRCESTLEESQGPKKNTQKFS